MIGRAGIELLNEIAVGAVDFNAVVPRDEAEFCRVGEGPDDRFYFRRHQSPSAALFVFTRPHRNMITKKSRIPENPGVVDLRNGERAVRVRQTDALLQGLEVVITDRAGLAGEALAVIAYERRAMDHHAEIPAAA